jgi:NAD(P)-dependent dehydrogenase (short-subunit alcohol dehydrogenase family)
MPRRVVVITGASAGVGRATARAFARTGADVGLVARGQDRLDATAAEVRALGGRALIAAADVADAEAVEAAAACVEDELGPIDVWVNNAMAAVLAPVVDTTAREFRRVTEVTYLGCVHGSLAALRRMRSRDRGTIIQVGSALAFRGIPLQATYCAAKHAIQGFTESLRCELLHDDSGVRLVSVHLPALNTPQFDWVHTTLDWQPRPVAPVFDPELAADAIVHAASHRRREYWVGGSTVKAIAGSQLAPSLADWYLARTGVQAQQASDRISTDRRSNLWEPPPGDPGSHGRFGAESRRASLQWWARKQLSRRER